MTNPINTLIFRFHSVSSNQIREIVMAFPSDKVPGHYKLPKTSFEKNCFSAWASTLNIGLINNVDMVCLSPVEYGV